MSIFDLSEQEFTLLSVLFGLALLPGLNAVQQNSLGNFLLSVGQVMETAANQQIVLESSPGAPTAQQLQQQIDQLKRQLQALEGRGGP